MISEQLKSAIIEHAAAAFPNESCGVVVNGLYIPCRNDSLTPLETFKINQLDKDRAEDLGDIEAYVHSHPNATARPSDFDKIQIELSDKPWIICSVPEFELTYNEPCGYKPPLVGRNFHHGWQDCYSLIRDFYDRELGIAIPNFDREDLWWEKPDAVSLYVENFKSAGFTQVHTPRYGDVLLFSIRSTHTNHAGIYLDSNDSFKSERTDPCIGSALILHHLHGRQSNREMLNTFWTDRMTHVLRHKDFIDA